MTQSTVTRDAFSTLLWASILSVYVLLLGVTGYLAFLSDVPRVSGGGGQYNPAHVPIEILKEVEALEKTRNFVLETLRADSSTYQKKRELASQSFNVVLGALLGFLSASATFAFGRRVTRQENKPTGEAVPNNAPQPTQ